MLLLGYHIELIVSQGIVLWAVHVHFNLFTHLNVTLALIALLRVTRIHFVLWDLMILITLSLDVPLWCSLLWVHKLRGLRLQVRRARMLFSHIHGFILELLENVNLIVCLFHLPWAVLERNSAIDVLVSSFQGFAWAACHWWVLLLESFSWGGCIVMLWEIEVRNWTVLVVKTLFEWVFSVDLVFKRLKVLLLDLKILVHFVKLGMLLFDFLLVLNLPSLNLLVPSFKCLWRDSVVSELFVC